VSPEALGGALDVLGSGGWLANKGSDTLYMVRIGDTSAKSDPINRGEKINPGESLFLPAAITLSEFGVFSDGSGGVANVLGT